MSSQSVDLPVTSTVGGKLIVTEDMLFFNLATYLGITIIFFIVAFVCLVLLYKWDVNRLRGILKKAQSNKVRFNIQKNKK